MSNSCEDLRDQYKNSRQRKYGLKGSSYKNRTMFKEKYTLFNDTIRKSDTTSSKNTNLNQLDKKYCIENDMIYSLNKKKRWQLKSDLLSQMNDLKEDNADVRLYTATFDEFDETKLNEIHSTKGGRTNKRYNSNFDSVLREERKNELMKNQPVENKPKVKKPNRFNPINRFEKKNKNVNQTERIIIEDEYEEEDDEAFSGTSRYYIVNVSKNKKVPNGPPPDYRDNYLSRARRNYIAPKAYYSDLDSYENEDSSDYEINSNSSNNALTHETDFEEYELTNKDVDFEEFVKKYAIQLVEKQKN